MSYEQTQLKINTEFKEQIQVMRDSHMTEREVQKSMNKFKNLSQTEKLLVVSSIDAIDPQSAIDVVNEL